MTLLLIAALSSDVSLFVLQQHSKIRVPVPTGLYAPQTNELRSVIRGNTHTLWEDAAILCKIFFKELGWRAWLYQEHTTTLAV